MSEQLKLDVEIKHPITEKMARQLQDWTCLYPFFEGPQWQKIKKELGPDMASLVPKIDDLFRAFSECRYKDLKVVWLGLCPYHTTDPYSKDLVADGLAFSTKQKHNVPPSLFKVYKAIENDLYNDINLNMLRYNELDFLAHQGILLANAGLTTVLGTAGKHTDIWKPFIHFLIDTLNKEKKGLLFTGFGKVANEMLTRVDRNVHTVIELEHPAASAYQSRDWHHEKIFSRTNEFLRTNGKQEILWDKYLVDMVDDNDDIPF